MDNCVGTNKSQFFFGELAILVLLGILDSIEFAFMVVGHTKFKPDVICRHIAGQYTLCVIAPADSGRTTLVYRSCATAISLETSSVGSFKQDRRSRW